MMLSCYFVCFTFVTIY